MMIDLQTSKKRYMKVISWSAINQHITQPSSIAVLQQQFLKKIKQNRFLARIESEK
jgi:hypothetical protein